MNRFFSSLVALMSGSGFLFALVVAEREATPVRQPIEFNHHLHAENGLECVFCHGGVESTPYATIPRTETCMECHEDADAGNPGLKVLLDATAAGVELPWERLYRLPAHVVFSHERHVALGGIACDACHGNHGSSERPPSRPEPLVLAMEGCMDCHADRGATNDCVECHR